MLICDVKGCDTRSGRSKGIPLFRMPRVILTQDDRDRRLTELRRRQFLANVYRSGVSEAAANNMRICSRHFVSGGKSGIVLLLFNAGPLNISFADESEEVNAIMECFYPAQATGEALVNVLFNKFGKASPAGRLPITWPKYDWQLPSMMNYSMKGRTYRYLLTDPLYPFGFGLSYSQFSYDYLAAFSSPNPKQNLSVQLLLSNIGNVDSDEVVQCYIAWQNKSLPVPQRQLAYFQRVHIKAGVQIGLNFSISWESWTFWSDNRWVIQAGTMDIYCGGQQPFQRKSAPSNVLAATFEIYNTIYIDLL